MPDLLHFAWPFQLGETVEQDSPEEHEAAAAVIACTLKGDRDDDRDFGVTQLIFNQRPLDVDRLAREIAQSDPRLSPTASEVIDLADAVKAAVDVDLGGEQRG